MMDDLVKKVNKAVAGHDLDDVIDVLMCALGVAIKDSDEIDGRLELILAVHGYLLNKCLVEE